MAGSVRLVVQLARSEAMFLDCLHSYGYEHKSDGCHDHREDAERYGDPPDERRNVSCVDEQQSPDKEDAAPGNVYSHSENLSHLEVAVNCAALKELEPARCELDKGTVITEHTVDDVEAHCWHESEPLQEDALPLEAAGEENFH